MKKHFTKFISLTLAIIITIGTFSFSTGFAESGNKEEVSLLAHQNWDFKLYNNFNSFKDSSELVKDSDYTTGDDLTFQPIFKNGFNASTAITTKINSNTSQSFLIQPTEGKGFKSDFSGAKEFWVWVDLSGLTKGFRKADFGFTCTDGHLYHPDDMDGISNMSFYIQGSSGNWQEKYFDTDGCMEDLGNYKGFIRFSTDYFVWGKQRIDLSKISAFQVWYDLLGDSGGEESTFVIDHVGFAGSTMADTDGKVADIASNGSLVLPSTLPKQTFDVNNIKLRYGAVSDLHITSDTGEATDKLKSALEQLKAKSGNNLDAVLAVGDLTDYGKDDHAQALKNVITSELNLDQTKFLFALGNHDYYDHSINKAPDKGGNLIKQYFGDSVYQGATAQEVQDGNYYTTVNGYDFIVVNCAQYDNGVQYRQEDIDWLKTQLAKAESDHPGQPIFVASHPTITNTTYSGNHAGAYYNSSDLYPVLKEYPQSIYFSGHTHYTLNDEKDIWQGDFTTVGTASVYYGCVDSYAADGSKYFDVKNDDPSDCHQFSQGLYVEVDKDNNVKLTRMDFYHQKEIKTAWIIPAPKADKSQLKYYTNERKLDNETPSFNTDATVKVVSKDVDKGTVTVEFNKAKDDDMVSSYLVQFVDKETNKTLKSIPVYSDYYQYPQVADMPSKLTYTFPSGTTAPFKADYEKDYYVQVIAVDSWNAKSAPIQSETYAGTPADPNKPVITVGAELHNDWNFKRFNNFNSFPVGYQLQTDVDYNSWPVPNDATAAKPEPIALNGYKSSAAITTKIYSDITHFTIYFPTADHNYKSDFTGAKEFWTWVDFSDVVFRKMYFGVKQNGAYGDEYQTDDFDGQTDMKAYIQDGSGGWKAVDFDTDGCLPQFGNYKGFIRFPLEYMKKGEDSLYPDNIQCFKLWFSPANADSIGKTFTFDEVGFAGPNMADADGTIQQLLSTNSPSDPSSSSSSGSSSSSKDHSSGEGSNQSPATDSSSSLSSNPSSALNSSPNSAANVTVSNSATGVSVTGSVLPSDVKLQVNPITDKSGVKYVAAQKSLGSNSIAALYDISLLQNNIEYEPNGRVTVSLPLPASLAGKSGVMIAHIKDDGSITYITPTIQNGIITFQTDSFSQYAVVLSSHSANNAATKNSAAAGSPKTGENPIIPMVVISIALLSIVCLIVMRKLTQRHSN